MDVWSWICGIPNSDEWSESHSSPLVYELASSKLSGRKPATQSIQLRAERTSESSSNSNDVASVSFSVSVGGFHHDEPKILWVSDACPLSFSSSSDDGSSFIPLVSQLVEEIISRSPTAHGRVIPRSRLRELLTVLLAHVMDSHDKDSFSTFFNLVFLTRLFSLCACDAPSEVGSFYFKSLFAPNLAALSCSRAPVLQFFFTSVGADLELCFMRALGYMFAKWLILGEVGGAGLLSSIPSTSPNHQGFGFSYATEAHGFWVLKGYAPVLSMNRTRSDGPSVLLGAKESVLRYALAHQQLEAVIQLQYSVGFFDGYIQVRAGVDNLRFHVAKLMYTNGAQDGGVYREAWHPVSRIRVRVGPELGSTYVTGLSLTRSTDNVERELEMKKSFRGSFGKQKMPKVVAKARAAMRAGTRNWRWDQDAEGNAAVFDAAVCDPTSGLDVATSKASNGERRSAGASRPISKTGGLVFAGDKYGQDVTWRLRRDVAGSVLRWRLGAQVWMTCWPNNEESSYCETRFVEWNHEVDLPLGLVN